MRATRTGVSKLSVGLVVILVVAVASVGGFYYFLPTRTAPQKIVNVNVSVGVTSFGLNTVGLYVAKAYGFWNQNGLNVTWTMVSGGPLSVKALIAGQTSFSYGAGGAMIGAISSGSPIKMILSSNSGTANVVLAQSKFKSPSDLKGANWAVESIGGTSYEQAIEYLVGVGMKPTDVNFVVVGSQPQRLQALIAQKVDVAIVDISTAVQASKYPYIVIFADTVTLGKYTLSPVGYFSTTTDILGKNASLAANFVKGFIQANRALATNETLFTSAMNAIAPNTYNSTVLHSFYQSLGAFWAINGGMNQGELKQYLGVYFTILNPTATTVTLQQAADYAPISTSLKSLGTNSQSSDKVDYSLAIGAPIRSDTTLAVPMTLKASELSVQ